MDLRKILDAIRFMARSGGGWRMLPIHFGPWETVYRWLRRPVRRLLFWTVHDDAMAQAGARPRGTLGRV